MSARKRPLEPGSDEQSDFGNKRQKVTHNGTNNNNNKEVTLELNSDIQKKIEENRLAALRRKEAKLAQEKGETSPLQSSQVKPHQLQQLQQHLRSPVRGGSSQPSQSSPSTSPSATSPVKDYAPIPMKRAEVAWASKSPPVEEKPSSAMKNSKITNYFVFDKDPPVKSPHFEKGADVPPKPQDLSNVARKINFDAKTATSPAKTPAIKLSKHDSNLSNGKYDANTQTDESQNMEDDNAFDLSVLCDSTQPPTQVLNNTSTQTQSTTKSSQLSTPSRATPPAAAPKKASPAPKKTVTPSKPVSTPLPTPNVRRDATSLNKFYRSEDTDMHTDDSSVLTESMDDRSSMRGSNGLTNNMKSYMTSASSIEDDEVDPVAKEKKKQKLKSHSISKSMEDEDEEATNLKKAALMKEDDEQKGDWWRNPRDKTGKKPGDPGYDPSTLYIPPDEFNKLTEAKKQYWTIKKDRFDEVIFFQQGDFYNLFGPDAEIGCEQLGLLYNARLMSVGVNRRDYREWARKFAALGFKVTRVDQESTAVTEKQKNLKQSQKKKTEERKVTELLTAGTMRDLDLFSDHNPSYLLILKEGDNPLKPQFGVCFVDTSTNEFGLCSFEDDERCSHFETILLQLKPKEILHDKGVLSPRVRKLIALIVGKVTMTARVFPSAQQAEDLINYGNYFAQSVNGDNSENWPEAIKQVRSDELLMQSLGAAVSYFEELNFAKEIVPVANYFHYDPNNQTKYLILDYVSLSNLEILQNNDTGAVEGSLLHTLNHCVTAFGKRTLRKWLCHPLRDVNILNDRFDCVEYFMEQADFRENLRAKFRGLNDVERYMTRVQACTVDLATFLTFIDNMQIIKDIIAEAQEIMNEQQTNAPLLNTLIMNFPDLDPFFELYSFDRVVARNQGKITPKPNTMPDYDEAVEKVNQITTELDNFLKTQKKNLGIASLEYHFSKSENYTIKVKPQFLTNKKVPSDWTEVAKLKAEIRYQAPTVVNLHAQLVQAKEELDGKSHQQLDSNDSSNLISIAICTRLLLEYLEKFDQVQNICRQAIEHLAQLDILMSFAVYAWQSESSMCRPRFVNDGTTKGSYAEFKNMRHPYLKPSSGIFVPNDIKLGDDTPKVLLITGPNMGGKSTILRQVAILTVMAQVGCFVPAENAMLTPVDRIFTRIGARDNIMGGLSTFMVELEETAKMLKYATGRSLVILDELGRGTSTFDGYSIAYAVLKHLETLDCRVLFSTHYHKLTDEFTDGTGASTGHNRHILSKSIASSHMACKEEDGHMTFLYKLQPGACPKSYGMHVASMANIPQAIIQRADEMSAKFEDIVAQRRKKQQQKKEETFVQLLEATPNAASNHQLILSLWRDCRKIVV